MKKSHALKVLGGSVSSAARAVGVSYHAVDRWPDELSPRIADRVIAAVAREHKPEWLRDLLTEAADTAGQPG